MKKMVFFFKKKVKLINFFKKDNPKIAFAIQTKEIPDNMPNFLVILNIFFYF